MKLVRISTAVILGVIMLSCAACSLFSGSTPTSIESPTQIITAPNESTETITRNYEWNYKRRDWTWNLSIPTSLYDYYKERPRAQTADYSIYVTHPSDDQYIQMLADNIKKAATDAKYSEKDTINLAISFVQSVPYLTDNVTTAFDEYPRYPIETLVDQEGDCEDTAILMAALLDAMGYSVVLISPPNHMAVGILGIEGMSGTYWDHNGGKYYYIETTGSNWEVGQLPAEYTGETAHIYDIIPVPILTHDWKSESSRGKLTMTVTVENLGTAAADGVYVYAGFDAGNNMLWNTKESATFNLSPDQSIVIHMELSIPKDKYTRIQVQIVYNNYSVDKSYSTWFDT